MIATPIPQPDTATVDRGPRTGRRRTLSALALTLVASMFGVFGLSMSTAHAASGGWVECTTESSYGGTISVHPGQTTPGATAVEYLTFYNWGTGQWQQTGQTARETTASGIFYDTIQFNPLPYHQQYYAIWEVLYLGGRVIGAGWYTSYDHGPWSFFYTGPRYTSSCWNP